MNELIEKLLYEAELDIVWDQDNPDYKWVEGSEESLLKFAELIVREMLDIFDKRAEPGTGFYEPQEPAEMIRQHFGVEE